MKILDSLMMQLRQAVNNGACTTMLYYHQGRVQGFTYSMPYGSIEALAVCNEAKFLVNDYAYRHGEK